MKTRRVYIGVVWVVSLGEAIAGFAKVNPVVLAVASLGFGGLIGVARALRKTAGKGETVLVRVYDPQERTWEDVEMTEVAPGVYVDRERKMLALIPVEATPDYVRGRGKVYTAAKIGNFVGYVDTVKGVSLALARQGAGGEGEPFHRLVRRLYELGIVGSRLELRPDAELYVYVDGRRLADISAEIYGVTAGRAIMGVADMTGQVEAFLQMLDKLAEYHERKAESTIKIVMAIGAVLMIVGILLAAVSGGR